MKPQVPRTIGHSFLLAAEQYPDRHFVRHMGGSITYGQAAVTLVSTLETLTALGIRRGDFVACYLEEQLPSLFFQLACAIGGIVPAPLSPVFSADYLDRGIVQKLGAAAVFTTPAQLHAVRGLGKPVVCYASPELEGASPELNLICDLPVSSKEAVSRLGEAVVGLDADDLFMIQPTSGSTGDPKLVVRRHAAFLRYAHFVGDQLELSVEEPVRFLMVATLTHAFGFHMLTTCLRGAGTLCIPSGIDTAASLLEVRELDPIVLSLLPRIQRAFARQHEQIGDQSMFGPSARFICSAGGCPDARFLEQMQKSNIDVIEFYGSSEASIVAVTHRGQWRPGWAGRVVADAEVKVSDDGELLVRSPGLTPGYFGEDELTHSVFDDGFYCTGDLGEVTPEGFLRILGRKRDVFNTPEGANIYPARIEQLIESRPWVEQAILIGDQRRFVSALVVLRREFAARDGVTGPLKVAEHAELYRRVGAELRELNEQLERVERILRFALFCAPFPEDCYRIVGPGKVRRDRKVIDRTFHDAITYLYTGTTVDESFVPDIERRLRPNQGRGVAAEMGGQP